MVKKRVATKSGFTMLELVIAMVIAAIVILGVGFIVVDGQRAWGVMYNRIYSDAATDSYVAVEEFDAVVRRASGEKFLLSEDSDWVEIYYPGDTSSDIVDRYARFSYAAGGGDSKGRFLVEYGKLNPKELLNTKIISEDVSACVFKASGRSVQMMLTLNDGTQAVTVVSSAFMHNQ
jgi:prepilin-type N-terminal cleavage/methylation domain-containing protein